MTKLKVLAFALAALVFAAEALPNFGFFARGTGKRGGAAAPNPPTSTLATPFHGFVRVTFASGGGGAATLYRVECKEDTQSDTYYGTVYMETTTTVQAVDVLMPNDTPHDCRIRAEGTGNSAWVTTGMQDFTPSAHAEMLRNNFTAAWLGKLLNKLFQNEGCTTAVDTQGQTVECVQDAIGTNHATNAGGTPQVATWDEDDGLVWNGGAEAQEQYSLTSTLSTTGDVALAGYARFDGNQLAALGSIGTSHFLRLRPNSTATSDDVRIRIAGTTNIIDNFVQTASNANWWIMWLIQRDEIAGAGNDTLTVWAANLGDDLNNPDVSDWTQVHVTTDGDAITSGTAVIEGLIEMDIWGNNSTNTSLVGIHSLFAWSPVLFSTAQERTDLFNQMLQSVQN